MLSTAADGKKTQKAPFISPSPLSLRRCRERPCLSPPWPGRLLTPRGGARPRRRWRSPRGGAVARNGVATRSRGASGKGVRANTRASRVPISGCLCPLPHAVRVLGLLRNSLCYFSHLHLMLVFFARRIATLPPGAVWDQPAVHSGVL